MNNEIQIFDYQGSTVRTVEHNGEVWFIAKDVCDILGLADVSSALRGLDDDEKMTLQDKRSHSGQRGGAQFLNVINESGVYTLIFRSNKPGAKDFSRWVRHEVLPTIRKYGAYATPDTLEKIIADPSFGIKLLEALQLEREKTKALQAQAEIDRPKVIFADSVATSKDSILVRDLAKLLRQNGYMTGEKRLYSELRERGYIMKFSTMPTQKSMEQGLMEVLERTINRGDDDSIVRRTTKITGKGQVFFIHMFLRDRLN